jgi:hypothetical protein
MPARTDDTMKLQFPFMQLPIQFDADVLAREVLALDPSCWRARMGGVAGNSALPLITTGGAIESDELGGDMQPTPWLQRCPYVMQVMDALGATWGRSRLMRLSGRSHLAAHVDTNYYWQERMRVHVPIVTTPAVRFHCGDAEVNMGAGECWIFDTWRRHGVVNTGDVDRIHLVMDTVGGEGFWKQVAEGARPMGVANLPEQPWNPRLVAYDPDAATPALDFESNNVPVVMTPWEIREHISFLLREAVPDPRLAPIQRALSTFTRHWQAAWACHGEARAGWPRYRALLGSLRAELEALGIHQIGLRNEAGLMHALTACLFEVALADGADGQGEGRRDHHGSLAHADAAPAVPRDAATDDIGTTFDRPVFIVSPPRSGSTLLFETLASAPGVFTIGDESHGLIEGIAALSPAQRGFDSNRLLAADADEHVVAQLRQRFVAALRDRERRPAPAAAVRMLEKTPKNALRIPLLRKVFPDARFIYLHRDPRQVLGSMLDGWQSGDFRTYSALPGWQGPAWSFLLVPGWRGLSGKPLEDIVAAQWARTSQILLDDLDALPAECWIGLDYERFVGDPQGEATRACRWAGFDWDRTLGETLPLSRYTLTPPDANKWRRHAAHIEPRLAALQPLVERAHAASRH